MFNDLKTKNALLKISELILLKSINRLLSAKSSTLAGKFVKQYLISTNIVSESYREDFNLETLDFETQIMVNQLKNLMKV